MTTTKSLIGALTLAVVIAGVAASSAEAKNYPLAPIGLIKNAQTGQFQTLIPNAPHPNYSAPVTMTAPQGPTCVHAVNQITYRQGPAILYCK